MELYDKIHENEELKTYILAGNRVLGELGFTEHGLAHAGTVSKMSREILEILNYSDHECELAAVAGYMHDIGNMINRCDHAQSGGILAFNILRSLDVNPKDIALIVGDRTPRRKDGGARQPDRRGAHPRGQERRAQKPRQKQQNSQHGHSRQGQLRGRGLGA